MSLTHQIGSMIPASERGAGVEIFASGGVEIFEEFSNSLEATVNEKGERFLVTLDNEKWAVVYSCECRRYEQTLEPCRHVYAAMRAAEARGLVKRWPTAA